MKYDLSTQKVDLINSFKRKWYMYVASVLIAVLCCYAIYYLFTKPKQSERFYVWIAAPAEIEEEFKDQIKSVAYNNGMREVIIDCYNPTDPNYFWAFGIKGNTTTNVYVLHKDEVPLHIEANIFMDLTETPYFNSETNLYVEEVPYGIAFAGDYYIMINGVNGKLHAVYPVVETMIDYAKEHAEDNSEAI